MEISAEILVLLCAFAFLAGFIDSVVGGGGLIQVPALLVLLPGVPPATVFGTNKFSSVWGTLAATIQYLRKIPLEWRATLPAALMALIFGYAGAWTVARVDTGFLRPLVLILLLAVLVYTLWKKDFGQLHAPRLNPRQQRWLGLLVGAAIGFYDGFFGPGTGSFLIFAFVGLFGFSFLAASASAKVVNLITNSAALGFFLFHGHVIYAAAAPMALFNVAGATLGARMAIKKGSGFVRLLFIGIVSLLLLRYAYDVFFS